MSKQMFRFSPRPNKANRIKWYQWGEEAFNKAKEQDKPLLLSISAVWCHWCHVMDETSYSDDRNIEFINEKFIPVRVDSDQNPDINERYNMGGWPTTAVLTPEGRILNGGTYMPPEELYDFLSKTVDYYDKHKLAIKNIEEIGKIKSKREARRIYRPLSRNLLEVVKKYLDDNIRSNYDKLYGGFGLAPKFPYPDILNYLIDEYARNRDDHIFHMLGKTLDNMADGGIYDSEAGGFFRYSTTRDWTIPHYEKMLEDNAMLVDTYLRAHQVTGISKYREVASKTIGYMLHELYDDKQMIFYGSQDANEEFYKLSLDQRKMKKRPAIDRNIYTSWNAKAVSAFLRAWVVLDEDKYRDIALNALNFLNEKCFKEEEGYCRYYDESPHNFNILSEQVYMAIANIDGFQYTGDRKYLKKAEEIAYIVYNRFYDSEKNAFNEDVPRDEVLKALDNIKDISNNSLMVWFYAVLNTLKDNEKYQRTAKEVVKYFSERYTDYGIFSSPYVKALTAYTEGIIHVSIVGDETGEIAKNVFKVYVPNTFVEQLDLKKDADIIKNRGYDTVRLPVVYVCIGTKCMNPVYNSKQLMETLKAICGLHL